MEKQITEHISKCLIGRTIVGFLPTEDGPYQITLVLDDGTGLLCDAWELSDGFVSVSNMQGMVADKRKELETLRESMAYLDFIPAKKVAKKVVKKAVAKRPTAFSKERRGLPA